MSREGRPASVQAPGRGLSARLLGRLHVTGVFWYRFHFWGARHAPRWAIAPLILGFTAFFFLALRRIGRNVRDNLVPVLGPAGRLEGRLRTWRTLHRYAWCLTERYEHLSGAHRLEMDVDNLEAWRGVADGGGGFIVLTAHIAAWEAAAGLIGDREGRRVHVVREQELDPRAQSFVRRLLERSAGELMVTHFAGDPLLAADLAAALERGEVVALQGDRPRSGGRAVTAPLFGRPFALPVGPLALARLAAVPLLPVFAFREGRRHYRIVVREPIEVAATEDRRGDLERAAGAVASGLEWAIRRAPHQWFCFGRAWDQPAGSSKKRLSSAVTSVSPSSDASAS